MNLKSALYSSSSATVLSISLLLTACGTDNTSTSNSKNTKQQTIGLTLAFNGFSGSDSSYNLKPQNLIGDLSAVDPANLYLYDTFIKNVGTLKIPSVATPSDYRRALPASGTTIQTGLTVLNPDLAIDKDPNLKSLVSKLSPTKGHAVTLSIPAGIPQRPEAPFFPAGTRYTALIIETSDKAGENHGATISIESGTTPLQFAAFTHQQDKTFTLRVYDKTSTVDTSGARALLTASTKPGVIQSRFAVITADGVANSNLSLASLNRSSLPDFGVANGKALLKSMSSDVHQKNSLFPQLMNSKLEPIFNDGDHGVFCLGGNNTFANVDLKDQTFVYPISPISKATRIKNVDVSGDSGFITESGKHIEVDTLNGNGELRIITVMKGAVAVDPIVRVKALNGVNKVNVVVGVVEPTFSLPATVVTLLSFDNALATPLVVNTIDAHVAGSFYDGESELQGNKVVLKSLNKKTGLSSGALALRTLAHHPKTQGISSHTMHSLIAMLDPLASIKTTLGNTSAALSQHALGLQLNAAPCSSNQSVIAVTQHVNISASQCLDNSIASINFNSKLGEVDLITSFYGLTGSVQKDITFGSSVTALKSFEMGGFKLIPSVAVGYSMDSFSDKTLSAQGINVQLAETGINSAFARFMTALNHNHNGLSATLAMGLEARHAVFNNGRAFTAYDSVSLVGEFANGLYSVVEASFASNSTQLNITLSNFNHAQIQFGFND